MTPRAQAAAFYNQAIALTQQGGDISMAYRLLSSAVTVDPTFGQAHHWLGNALGDLKMLPAAVASFRRALQCPDGDEPGDMNRETRVKSLVNMGHRLYWLGDLKGAELACNMALDIDPECGFAWSNLSMVQSVWGDNEGAVWSARNGHKLDPSVLPRMQLAFAQLFNRDVYNGLRNFEARFEHKLPQFLAYPYPRWDGARVEKLLVVSEQGMGDTLCFSRFYEAARERVGSMVCMVQKELVGLFRATFPGIEFTYLEDRFPIADAWCPIGSLPIPLDLSNDEILASPWPKFPILPTADLGEGFHIAIAWKGSSSNDIDPLRSLRFEDFLRLYDVPGVQLHSIQVGEGASDLHAYGAAGLVRDRAPFITDVADTAAFMRSCDLVISVESFVAHLAGALGVECWVPYSYRGGDWRYGRGFESPVWSPTTRIFRQGDDERWGPVWNRIVEALRERAAR